jgi:hypothetical protein
VGKEVEFFKKKVRIVDCDDFTRAFYENLGVSQPPYEDYPIDNFEKEIYTQINRSY